MVPNEFSDFETHIVGKFLDTRQVDVVDPARHGVFQCQPPYPVVFPLLLRLVGVVRHVC